MLAEEIDDPELLRQVEKAQAKQKRSALRLGKEINQNQLLRSSDLDD